MRTLKDAESDVMQEWMGMMQPESDVESVYLNKDTLEINKTFKGAPENPNAAGGTAFFNSGGPIQRIESVQRIERALDDIYPPPQGTKYDEGKPMMSLIDPYVLTEMARVLTFGAKKYDPDNWRKGFNLRRILDACLRHITAWSSGQDLDEETGLSHLAHAMCCLMFLMWLYKFRPELDDRYKEPAV